MKKTKLILSMLGLGVVGITTPLVMTSCSDNTTPQCDTYTYVGKAVDENKLIINLKKMIGHNVYWKDDIGPDSLKNLLIDNGNVQQEEMVKLLESLNKEKPQTYIFYKYNGNLKAYEIPIPYIDYYTK